MPDSHTEQESSETPLIFISTSGSPLNIYLDLVGLKNRNKLVRALRKAGAHISHNPHDAELLLINSQRASGKQVLRDWGADNKVALEYHWARTCLAKGRPLLQEDAWGGFKAVDDGAPIHSDQEDNEDNGNHVSGQGSHENRLPTPRLTPLRPEVATSEELQPVSTSEQRAPASQPIPSSSRTPFTSHAATLSDATTLTPCEHSLCQPPPTARSNETEELLNIARLVHTAITTSQRQSLDTALLDAFLKTLPTGSTTLSQVTFATPARDPGKRKETNVEPSIVPSPELTPSSNDDVTIMTPSSKGKTPSSKGTVAASQSPTSLDKGKGKPAQTLLSTPTSSSFSSQSLNDALHKKVARSSSFQPAINSPSMSKWKSETGFILYLLSRRVRVTETCERTSLSCPQKHGGKITTDIAVASFAILNSRSKPFNLFSREASSFRTTVVQPSFIHDCVSEGRLLEFDAYIPQEAHSPRKRGRAHAHEDESPRKKPRSSLLPTDDEPSSEAEESADGAEEAPDLPEFEEANPDPPSSSQVMPGGKYRFTDDEWDYCWTLARKLLEANSKTTTRDLCRRLHEKAITASQSNVLVIFDAQESRRVSAD
ncbi:hypothetical protein EW146_g4123 [Bondarzewia mesenterica]|uniref:BRCT domain-containing protein n=1 Tax=Bondarzewia mesenterica TaxID=1095465 RepID=A0A4S4LVF5_9AGAM|nr:hypothetical protein EW146_g4123 [Bondarzewia mesenterica]